MLPPRLSTWQIILNRFFAPVNFGDIATYPGSELGYWTIDGIVDFAVFVYDLNAVRFRPYVVRVLQGKVNNGIMVQNGNMFKMA